VPLAKVEVAEDGVVEVLNREAADPHVVRCALATASSESSSIATWGMIILGGDPERFPSLFSENTFGNLSMFLPYSSFSFMRVFQK